MMDKIATFPLFYPKRQIPNYQISQEKEEILENYQIFQAKKNNNYEKILFGSREKNDKFPEDEECVQKEKTQYLSNLMSKHKNFFPWELLKNKLFITRNQGVNKPLPFLTNIIVEEDKTNKPKEKDKKKQGKTTELILEENEAKAGGDLEIVESSMEDASSHHGSFEDDGRDAYEEGSAGGDND